MAIFLITVHLGRHFRIFGHYDYKVLLKMGHQVHIASNFSNMLDNFDDPNVVKHQIDFVRTPFESGNLKALKQLIALLNEHNFDCIHTQSPMGGVLTRIAALLCRKKTRVIYTAHGLHFFKGAPVQNWLFYYPVEKILSYFTDRLITMNEEDFYSAEKLLNTPSVDKIPGVGVDLQKYSPLPAEQKTIYKVKYGFNRNDFLILCVGELNSVKRQDILINSISRLSDSYPFVHLLLAGIGEKKNEFEKQALSLGIQKNVHFLGYRKDVPDLLKASDLVVSSSSREGLPLNLLEAMATGLPIIASDCRGNRDLVKHDQNGYLIRFGDVESFCSAIEYLLKNPEKLHTFGIVSEKMARKFSIENVESEMMRIYGNALRY